jgi:hypothetical protein
MDRIEMLAKGEQAVDPSLSREAAIARVASDPRNRALVEAYKNDHQANARAVERMEDPIKAAAEWRIRDAIDRAKKGGLNQAQATAVVLKSEAGKRDWGVLIGAPERERPQAPVSKSDDPFAAIAAVAEEIRKADPKLTREAAISKAAESRPDLCGEYRAAMDAEVEAAQQT